MYRYGSAYDELDRIIYSIYMDYNIRTLPIDERELCRKLGVALVPYSAYSPNDSKTLLIKKSKQAFFVRESHYYKAGNTLPNPSELKQGETLYEKHKFLFKGVR